MSICIGPVVLDAPVILAPMSGVTDLPFRALVKRLGAPLVVSEMIASEAMIRENRKTLKMAAASPEEQPMAVQLAGCEPAVVAEAARLNADRGAAIIDINMGCPVKKVVNGHAGSALMRDERHAGRILAAVVAAVDLPVTVKIRTGWDDANRNAPTIARIAEDSGVKMVTVHGRTRCQFYHGRADWRFIGEVKAAVTIPVIGNGDVTTVEAAREMLDQSGADGVMIGRGVCGRPWFINQVVAYLDDGRRLADPPLDQQFAILKEHYEALLTYYGTHAGSRIARKHIGWYSKGLHGSSQFREAVNRSADVSQVREHMRAFYMPLIERAAA